jgi:hypothetical protein
VAYCLGAITDNHIKGSLSDLMKNIVQGRQSGVK